MGSSDITGGRKLPIGFVPGRLDVLFYLFIWGVERKVFFLKGSN